VEGLSWRDEHGVVHAMLDDEGAEREPPYPLISRCGFMHHHDHSEAIRTEAQQAPVSGLVCLTQETPLKQWPDNDDAPCCS
jgi:hypothetical protein